MVLYSVFEGTVTPGQLEGWFRDLGLDEKFLPAPIRSVDAFEKVTGPCGICRSYPLDDPGGNAASRRRRTRQDGKGREATPMIRHVRRDKDQVVRHLVREVRDEASVKLSYDVRRAECVFRRDQAPSVPHGAGTLLVTPDYEAIRQLPQAEHDTVGQVLTELQAAYRHHCTDLTGDRLRAVIRGYIEGLSAVRMRPTGGEYFVHRSHSGTLAALRELVSRFGDGSHLSRVPVPDEDEMREMITTAFTTRARDELAKLAIDIATAQRDGVGGAALATLHKRFRDLQASAAEHARLLSTSLDDTKATLQLVNTQLASLLANAS